MLTVAELRTQVRSLTSILESSILSDADIDRYLSMAHVQMCLEHDWPFLRSPVSVLVEAGDTYNVLPLPPDRGAQRVRDVYAWRNPGDKPVRLEERGEPDVPEGTRGFPREFSWDGQILMLFPTPSERLTVRAHLVLDPRGVVEPDGIDVPGPYRDALAYLASSMILEREADDTQRVFAFQARYQFLVAQMRTQLVASGRTSFKVGWSGTGRRGRRRRVL